MKKWMGLGMSALLLIAALTGCGTTQQETASNEISVSRTDSHYPVTVESYNYAGDVVTTTYEKAPERVIAVYQGSIETMLALGLEEHVVASYGLDNAVKEEWEDGLSKMNYHEEVFAPSKEDVMMLEPDMIFSWGSLFGEKKLGDVDQWISRGTNTYINTNTRAGGYDRTLEHEYTDILNIGKIFDVEEKAQALVDEMKQEIEDALAKTKGKEAQTVSVIEFLNDDISNYGASSLAGDMITQLGGELAAPDAKQVGKEDLVEQNPDVIFVVYMENSGDDGEDVKSTCVAKVMEDPAFASLDAVKNGRVYPIMLGDMYASGARTIDGIRNFAAGLYPELNKIIQKWVIQREPIFYHFVGSAVWCTDCFIVICGYHWFQQYLYGRCI